jgi:YbgC/YbaW family acyl-CoA thioester hydrolase
MGKPFTINERVRWVDCDPAQIIYYGAYIRFFEIAETEMYRSVGLPYAVAFKELGCFPIRAAYHCDYKSPALLDDLMEIAIWVSHWGRTSFTVSFRFMRAGTDVVLAEGYCRQVTVDRADKRPLPIPDRLRQALADYTVIPPAETPGES